MSKYVLTTRIKIQGLLAQINLTQLKSAKDNYMTSSRTIKYRGKKQSNSLKKIKTELRKIVNTHMEKGSCSKFEAILLLLKIDSFSIPHFYIIWNILKNPPVGRPIVALYNWILTAASIFVGYFLKNFTSNLMAF